MLAKDKTLHFNAGITIAFISYLFLVNVIPSLGGVIVPIVFAFLAGVLKEVRDHVTQDGNVEWMDIVWTTVGGIVGVTFGVIFF